MNNVLIAFCFTLVAGLSTSIGSLIAFLTKSTNKKFLSVSLGFSAGVMVYVSMIEIFPEAQESIASVLGERMGSIITVIAFFAGMFVIAIIDKLIPSEENPHELKFVEDLENTSDNNAKLIRTGLLTALASALHNFPEGLATFVSALDDPALALPIVFCNSYT